MVPHSGEWAVKGAGNIKATSVHDTQQQAIDAARAIARNQSSEMLIHGRDGQIHEKDSHGNGKSPPKHS
ncbi:DUF2188 domain-containing protein (plasmid) [Pantoea agglomerans]|uniref:DUF2188 domain-containing protein n=1 Tax=Enterobacter agglomerans TaxID=549 RepID=UPI001AA09D16|nr:DUF2188 domain-containing protein [Pantoea agglomerans]QTC52608.1 DUF2188 domain-containing protein [Pantoea agglomerans]